LLSINALSLLIKNMSKKIIIFLIILIILLALVGYWYYYKTSSSTNATINSFEECVAAGNPVMESYPRQCRANGQIFVEELPSQLTREEALLIASQSSACSVVGNLGDNVVYNENSRTWWIDLERTPELEKDGCKPACVVNEETETAEVNWRCTGLIEPKESAGEAIWRLFIQKYPKYAETSLITIEKETENYARGSVSFAPGEPGGLF